MILQILLQTHMFQFTHPGGVRLAMSSTANFALVFQFTHPGGVRLQMDPTELAKQIVSIHAPGRGATEQRRWLDTRL